MKRAFYFIAPILLSWIIGYLVGSFCAASFNLKEWSDINRGFTSFIFTSLGIAATLASVEEWSKPIKHY
jgi:hypothetical protein